MTSEAKEYVRPFRSGRMKGVMIPIDQETWERTLQMAGIPVNTPLDRLRIKRFAGKTKTILLKLSLLPTSG
jgi:hypothetical protein